MTRSSSPAEVEREIDAVTRRARPIFVVRGAQLLCRDSLLFLYGAWRTAADRRRTVPLILTGNAGLTNLLKRAHARPVLAGLRPVTGLGSWIRSGLEEGGQDLPR
ncbi:hypothetical protein ACWFR5_34590 [Streptomyces sp. NPDC055092]